MVIHYVYVVLEFCFDGGPVLVGLFDNHKAAQACVDAGRAVGLNRWFVTPYLEDEYNPENDFSVKNEQEEV